MSTSEASRHPLQEPTIAALLRRLRSGHALTQAEIADELKISKRHARRLVTQLREAEVPVIEQRRGREKEYLLPPDEQDGATLAFDLSEREAMALVVAAATLRTGREATPLPDALTRAFDRIVEALPAQVTTFEPDSLRDHIHVGEAASVEVDPDVFVDLLDAILNRRSVDIDYHTASTNTHHTGRTIEPWALARRGDAWMCVARDPAKDALRDFNLTRIGAVVPTDPESPGGDYRIDDDFDLELYFLDRFEAISDDALYCVELLVDPEMMPYFESKTHHRTQQIHADDRDDGRRVVSYEVAGLEEIASFVRSWGPTVEVLDPPELRQRIADDARATLTRYDDRESA